VGVGGHRVCGSIPRRFVGIGRISHQRSVNRGPERWKVLLQQGFEQIQEGSPLPTECCAKEMGLAPVDGRRVVAHFDGGTITLNAGVLLLGAADRAIGLIERFAGCFEDGRAGERVVHDISTLVGQRVLGMALSRGCWPCLLRGRKY